MPSNPGHTVRPFDFRGATTLIPPTVPRNVVRWEQQARLPVSIADAGGFDLMVVLDCGHRIHAAITEEDFTGMDWAAFHTTAPDSMGCPICGEEAQAKAADAIPPEPEQ